MKKMIWLTAFGICVSLAASVSYGDQGKAGTTVPKKKEGTKAPPEKYEQIDPDEFRDLDFRIAFGSIAYKNGAPVVVGGVVKKFTIGNTDIELVTNAIGVDPNDPTFLAVSTTKLGTVRFNMGIDFHVVIYLTPSQKRDLLKLRK